MDKRGTSLDNLYPAVISIVLIGIAIGLGIFILTQTSEAISTTTISVTNETITGLAIAGDYLATSTDCGSHDYSGYFLQAENTSEEIAIGNYTTTDEGQILATAGSEYIDSNMNVTYTYVGTGDTSTTGPCGAITTTGTGVGGMASWIAVIVVVLAAAIVLGIVVSSFGNKGSSV